MQKINLYRYETGGRVTITPFPKSETDISSRTRIVADKGFILTNGVDVAPLVDVKNEGIGLWSEIVDPDYKEEVIE